MAAAVMRPAWRTLPELRVRAEPSWFVLAAVVMLALGEGYFPTAYSGLPRVTHWVMSSAAATALFASILLHELAHGAVGRWYGVHSRGITLLAVGGRMEMGALPRPRAELLMAGAGPLANLLIAAVCAAALQLPRVGNSPAIGGTFAFITLANWLLAIVNAMPVFPLDGGRAVRALLWRRRRTLPAATRMAIVIGRWFAGLLIVAGVTVAFTLGSLYGWVGVTAGLYLLWRARSLSSAAPRTGGA